MAFWDPQLFETETLQEAYDIGQANGGIIVLSATGGPLFLKDASSTIGTLFKVTNNAGSVVYESISSNASQVIRSGVADGSTAVGTIIDTVTALTTAGAKILSVRSAASEMGYFGYTSSTDGGFIGARAVDAATAGPVQRGSSFYWDMNYWDGAASAGVLAKMRCTPVTISGAGDSCIWDLLYNGTTARGSFKWNNTGDNYGFYVSTLQKELILEGLGGSQTARLRVNYDSSSSTGSQSALGGEVWTPGTDVTQWAWRNQNAKFNATYENRSAVTAKLAKPEMWLGTDNGSGTTTPVMVISPSAGMLALKTFQFGSSGNSGDIFFGGDTSNVIRWNVNGVAAPSLNTRSAGAKVVLYPAVSASTADYAIGVESGYLWMGGAGSTDGIKFYAAATAFAIWDSSTGITFVSGSFKTNAANEQSTVGAAGTASALPGDPEGYIKFKDSGGVTRVIPYWKAS